MDICKTLFKPKTTMRVVIAGIFVLAASVPAMAKELYVDVSRGSDSVSYAQNNANNPWASIGRAAWGASNRNSPNSSQAAQAGDTVHVAGGTYSTTQGSGERYEPIYNPVNNGTPGNPITFIADGTVTLQSSTNSGGEPIIGTYGRSHIVWDGFYIDEINVNTTADTGPVVVWQSDNVAIQNLTVRGKTVNWGDNHNAIRIEYSTDSLIRNNRLSNVRGGANQYNGSAIMLYDSSRITIEHNEISDSQGGIFIKGAYGATANHEITVRYNLLYDLGVGITHGIVNNAGRAFGARTYQNIVHSSGSGIIFIGYNGSSPANIDVVNNTLYNNSNGFYLKPDTGGYRDIVFCNNIVRSGNVGIQGEDISDVSNTEFSHNIYSGVGTHARIAYTNYSLASWRSNFSQDSVGSSDADPLFQNASALDFRLGSGSPASGAGTDVLNLTGSGAGATINMGAYVTGDEIIGVTTAPLVMATVPAPPTLR